MADTPTDAPTPAPTEASVTPEQNTNPEPVQAPEANSVDLYGFTQDDLAGMRRFIDNNGGWDAIKAKISTPRSAQPVENPVENLQPKQNELPPRPQEPTFQTPKGAITASEFLAEQYFRSLAGEEKYANIADGVRNGDYLKEMSAFGIQALNPDGSINDQKVRMYLDLKAQTVPAKPTETEPNASNAPTVTYTEVGENGIANIDQAYKILMEPNNPAQAKAEEFIRNSYNPNSEKKQ